jgi:S-adenosylmethionine decarboxylase
MQGLHLTADLYRCRCDTQWLTDAQKLGDWCVQAIEAVGLQPVDRLFHTFPATASRPPCCWPNRMCACTPGPSKKA